MKQEEYALYYAEQNHKNKMAWVPTTDAQARIYFYNLYTRETSWVPPPGAPRIELEWWEKTYTQRMHKKVLKGEDDDENVDRAGVEAFSKSANL
jgi:hypothetical protein